jgi:hypothetical protein
VQIIVDKVENMSNKFIEYGRLQDMEIINALKESMYDYEDGAILEVRDVLEEIVKAIDEWDYNYSL